MEIKGKVEDKNYPQLNAIGYFVVVVVVIVVDIVVGGCVLMMFLYQGS